MFKVESDIDKFYQKQLKTFEQLASADKVLREAAFDTVVIISDRVQRTGKKTDGSPIGQYSEKTLNFKGITGNFEVFATKKQKKKRLKGFGDYDEFYGGYKELRESLGLQTQFVDLTFSGDMMGDLVPVPDGPTSYLVGFRGKKSSDTAGYNEKKYGVIFQLSPSELSFIMNKVNAKINEILS